MLKNFLHTSDHTFFPRILFFLSILFLVTGCSDKRELKNFEHKKWQSDKKGCNGFRSSYFRKITEEKKEFEGMDDDLLAELLGKPDKIFYSKRGKKTYEYFITPGKQCDEKYLKEGAKVVFEINSIGYVNLVFEKKF
ncbi:MAG TPA: hypothetical protein VF691_13035 [Cytophagaceae bacterium]|jgi:hypothetical protein